MTNTPVFTLLLSCLVAFSFGALFADTPSRKETLEIASTLHSGFEKIRKEDYGNVTFTVEDTQSVKSKGIETTQISEITYWSRENKFFRVDTEVIGGTDKESIGQKTRLIVRPEGYVKFMTLEPRGQLAIVELGSLAEGRSSLGGMNFMHASTRCITTSEGEVPFGNVGDFHLNEVSKKLKDFYSPIDITTNQDKQVHLLTRFQKLDGEISHSSIWRVVYDLSIGAVLSYELEKGETGESPRELRVEKSYDVPRLKGIPREANHKTVYLDGTIVIKKFRTVNVDWEPVPLGVFTVDTMGRTGDFSGTWLRRMIMLIVGLGFVGIYLTYRWRRHGG